jgi:hypothetical protein
MQEVLRAALAFHGFKALSKRTRRAAQLLQVHKKTAGLLDAELAGCLDRADLTDGHGFGTSHHAVHLTGGRACRHARPQKDFVSSFNSGMPPENYHFSAKCPRASLQERLDKGLIWAAGIPG